MFTSAALIIVIVAIVFFLTSGDSHWEKSEVVLKQNTRASITLTELELLRDAIKENRNIRDTIVTEQGVTGTPQTNVKGN